jgi:hypothetical protein
MKRCDLRSSDRALYSKKKGFQKGSLWKDRVLPRIILIRITLFGRQGFFIRQMFLPRTFNNHLEPIAAVNSLS